MKCIRCEMEARAVCRFCGRAVCKEHIMQEKFVTGQPARRGLMNWGVEPGGLSVHDDVWCGLCHPKSK